MGKIMNGIKKLFAAAALVAVSNSALAIGMYMPVGRDNDPFVFCTQGVPEDGWVAVNPLSGSWTAITEYPNLQWIPAFEAVCPAAMSMGVWMGPGQGMAIGVPGTGALVPFPH